MANSLEALPSDVLENIALHAVVGSYLALGVPSRILPLLLTSSTLHRILCMKSCPHLYADIFRETFDIDAVLRRLKFQVTDSALASELVVRCQTLQRIRRRCLSPDYLRKDLWAAFWMIEESDGLNEMHLRDVHLPDYLLEVVKHWDDQGDDHGLAQELYSLVIWLLCLTLTQRKPFTIAMSFLPHPPSHDMNTEHIWSFTPDVKATLQHRLLPYSRNVHGVRTSFLSRPVDPSHRT